MKTIKFILLTLVSLSLACAAKNAVVQTPENTRQNSSTEFDNSIKTTNKIAEPTKTPTPIKRESPSSNPPPNQSLDKAELQELLGAFGDTFAVVDSYQPDYLTGDFNGDSSADIAIVGTAVERNDENSAPVNILDKLCQANADVSLQNIYREKSFLPARPKQSCSQLEAKKDLLKPTKNSQYGLFVMFGDKNGWKNAVKQLQYGKKIVLLDALFKYDFSKKNVKAISLIEKDFVGEDCFNAQAKGDMILSGDALSTDAIVIYFDGRKFGWQPCGN